MVEWLGLRNRGAPLIEPDVMIHSQSSTPVGPLWENQSRIDPRHVQMGHFVARLDKPWEDSPFMMQGVLVDNEDTKLWLVRHCAWVVIDLERSLNKAPPTSHARITPGGRQPSDRDAITHPVNILRRARVDRKTMKAALRGYIALDKQARRLIKAFAEGGQLDVHTARSVVKELSSAMEHNLAAMVWLTRIKQQDNYTAEHCINVAILAMGLAHALEWKQPDIELAGVAGLLHDLGKMKLDTSILNKVEQLTPEEFEHLKSHALVGYELLSEDPDVSENITQAVRDHHERPDGHGYPHGKHGAEISPLSSLVAIVDAYDAITSHRVYDAARSHHEALGILWQQRGKQFDKDMVEVFIQFMGWVTPGTLVRLSNNQLAIVVQAKPGQRLLPVVRLLDPSNDGYALGETCDLSTRLTPEGDMQLRIAQVLPDGAEGVDMVRMSADYIAR
ncbi:HD family phosphohydrolase [Saccharospirillum salsuginis]|uniref:HD family phosphohydrolase n=2 Tax=Saccharospirillum salsuginis TaxID=418750 RepID=A0A918N7V5_9GAMM|nr:HD family phosphohydrolase [Saccharospirillum salsuginis]